MFSRGDRVTAVDLAERGRNAHAASTLKAGEEYTVRRSSPSELGEVVQLFEASFTAETGNRGWYLADRFATAPTNTDGLDKRVKEGV